MTDTNKIIQGMAEDIIRQAADRGQIIEAGWIGLRYAAVAKDAPAIQLKEMRMAFFAGAQHLFSSILTVLEPDAEPTEADLRRMDMIKSELDEFLRQFRAEHGIG